MSNDRQDPYEWACEDGVACKCGCNVLRIVETFLFKGCHVECPRCGACGPTRFTRPGAIEDWKEFVKA